MTCQAKVTGPDGKVTTARIFLDPGAAYSFITERLAQQLGLLRQKDHLLIPGIAGVNETCTHGAISFTVSHLHRRGKQIHVPHAFVLPNVTTVMLATPVRSIEKWKHLMCPDLANPEFGTHAHVHMLLGTNYYGEILLRGRQWGP